MVSREKLAYIVDSTAAPVTVIVFVSTWVGFEIGLIGDGLRLAASQNAGDAAMAGALTDASPFGVFLQTIPFLFYPIFAIFTVGLLVWTGRDFGPMLEAERRAASGGGLHRAGAQLAGDTDAELGEAPDGTPLRWWNGALPIITVVVTVLVGLWYSGAQAFPADASPSLWEVLGEADPYATLLWGSLLGCLVAILLAVTQRILSVRHAITAWMGGIKAMLLAIVILILAWSLGEVTTATGTAAFLSNTISDRMPMEFLPVVVFVIAGLMAFATGTSWATMGILLPLVIPLTIALSGAGANVVGSTVLLSVIASVMAGAIFGDHCSPISDTTVLSSMASGCDHLDHVRTQLPYAVTIAAVATFVGVIPTAFGVPAWLALVAGIAVIWVIVRLVGKPVTSEAA
jgi:Na+/H+ antiporter NhaC